MKIGPGSRFGDAVLEERLAEGATAAVWRATWRDRVVVVKLPHAAGTATDELVARVEREAAALAAIRCENVVRVLDVGRTTDGIPWVVLEHVEGATLRAVLDADGALPPARAAKLLDGLAAGLAAAHEAGVVHRDVKPENVMLDGDVAKLVDFGLAKPRADVAKLTSTGTPLGTPAYMAPEQWWNDGVGPAADQYAFGLVAFEVLTGAPAFPESALPELMEAHLHREPALDALPPRAATALRRMLAKAPAERFPGMTEARAALAEALGAAPSPAPRPSGAERALPWVLAVVLPLVVFAYGYPGARDPRASIPLAGWAVFGVFGAYAVGVVLLRRTWLTALLPAILGTFATYTGWQAVLRNVAELPAAERVPVFHQGLYEANVNRFFGLGLSAALFFCLAAAEPSKTLRDATARATAIALALGFTAGAIAIRLRSSADLVWTTGLPRGARVEALLAQARVTDATRPIVLAVIAIVCVGLVLRLLQRSRDGRQYLALRSAIARGPALALVAWIAIDGFMLVRLRDHVADVVASQATELELMAQLDPPSADGLPPAPVGPALKIARDRVLVDDTPVGLTSALERGGLDEVLRTDLSHRLARDEAGPALLVLLADRSVPTAAVARALDVAASVGVREVHVLYTRGPSPSLGGETGEIAATLPSDFGAQRLALPAPGLPGTRWDETALALLGPRQ